MTPRLPGVICILCLAAAQPGCGDDAPPARPAPQPGAVPLQGTPSPPRQGSGGSQEPPLTPEQERARKLAEDMRRTEEMRKDYDRQAHALLDAFRGLAYDPARDGGLRAAEGTIDVVVDGRTAQYRFTFDAEIPDVQKQVGLEVVREDVGIHADAAKQAKRFAVLAARGPYSFVISYDPPILWEVVRSEDDHLIAVAPPHKSRIGVSYRMDRKGLVEIRGTSNGKQVSRTVFEWKPRGAAWTLARAVDDGGTTTISYEYAEQEGIAALRDAKIAAGEHVYAAKLVWERIRTR